jgi:hypothetical protein
VVKAKCSQSSRWSKSGVTARRDVGSSDVALRYRFSPNKFDLPDGWD